MVIRISQKRSTESGKSTFLSATLTLPHFMPVLLSSPEGYPSTDGSQCFHSSGDPAIKLSEILHFSLTIMFHYRFIYLI